MPTQRVIKVAAMAVAVAVAVAMAVAFFAGVALLLVFPPGFCYEHQISMIGGGESKNNTLSSTTATHRKLLNQREKAKQPDRSSEEKCVSSDVLIRQSPTDPLSSGIPAYYVEIVNNCFTGCNISGIHINCGLFSSAKFIDPKIFKQLSYDECLVNDGKPLVSGGTIDFTYANTYVYQLSVSSVLCP
ncbi:Protein TAPETUM DETERMINANT [Parasponia andersonii]|uniref:Protein TAPETUM DETERMINANT n=1 Tax=Parasponia andersonii TaxID=3476 RepID=A0A2P5DVA3_PARAD|nr:Protein TAPETUM DETERMINANT [Parasponia andersonii]